MSLKIKLEKPVSEYTGGGKPFVQPYHAYKAKITKVEENKGWINVYIETADAKSGEYDKLSVKSDSQYLIATVGKWANAVVQSNPKLAEAGAKTEIDMSKWAGLDIGVVYRVSMDKDTGYMEESRFSEPHFAIPTSEVEGWEVGTVAYEAWREKFWSKGDGESNTTTTPTTLTTASGTQSVTPTQVIDEDLPF
jgi:hypothetical protein